MSLSTYTREFGTNLKLAYPVIVGMLGHTVVQLIDNIMVGQLGTTNWLLFHWATVLYLLQCP